MQFCRPDDLAELTGRADEYVSTDEAQIAQRLRNLADEPASWSMPEEHWSLGGQQEKFALAARAGGWFEAHGAAATTHILKPGIRVLRRQALVEHVTMRAAALLGVDTAATTYLRFEDQWAVVVERFDRLTDADGQVQRLHQEDFCQAVGRLPAHKYEARGGPTLADMVGVVQKQSRDQEADKLALADFLIVNVVTGAPDGHAKNVSMLRLADGAWIAPLPHASGAASGSARQRRSDCPSTVFWVVSSSSLAPTPMPSRKRWTSSATPTAPRTWASVRCRERERTARGSSTSSPEGGPARSRRGRGRGRGRGRTGDAVGGVPPEVISPLIRHCDGRLAACPPAAWRSPRPTSWLMRSMPRPPASRV